MVTTGRHSDSFELGDDCLVRHKGQVSSPATEVLSDSHNGGLLLEVSQIKIFDVHSFSLNLVSQLSDVFVFFVSTGFPFDHQKGAAFLCRLSHTETESCLASAKLNEVAFKQLFRSHKLHYLGLLVRVLQLWSKPIHLLLDVLDLLKHRKKPGVLCRVLIAHFAIHKLKFFKRKLVVRIRNHSCLRFRHVYVELVKWLGFHRFKLDEFGADF